MNLAAVDAGLREALQRITRNCGGRDVRAQVEEVEHLRKRLPHSIRVLDVVEDARPGPGQFTCFMHALEITSPPPLVAKIMERFDLVYPGAEFINSLISGRLLEETQKPEDGDVVIYFRDEAPKHAGKVRGEAIISKWGLGHVWQHAVFEVPESYGDVIRTFKKVERESASGWFIDYAIGLVGPATIAEIAQADA